MRMDRGALRVIQNIKKNTKIAAKHLIHSLSFQKFQLPLSILRDPSSLLKIWAKLRRKMDQISEKILTWKKLLNCCIFFNSDLWMAYNFPDLSINTNNSRIQDRIE